MRKPLKVLTVAAAVSMGSLLGNTTVNTEAASVSGLQKQQDQVQNKRSNLNTNINEADQKISKLKGQQADVQSEIQQIGQSIDSTAAAINEKTVKVNATKTQIAKLQDEMKVIQVRIEKRNEVLKERARNFQENGGPVDYIAVLFGAQTFSDFIDRAGAVATIMQADQTILTQAESDEQELQQKQTQVQTDLSTLQKMVQDLEVLHNQLNSQKAEQDKLLASLKEQQKQVENEKMSMQEQDQLLAAQESAINQAIQLAQEQAAAAKAPSSSSSTSSTSSSVSTPSNSGSSVSAPPVSSGTFTSPTTGVITSPFGARDGGYHYGVDFAESGSQVPIVAAANGVVSRSYLSSSYGECVFITHYINGQLYTTVYAHMRVRFVHDGDTVSKGQLVGYMGYTGDVSPPGPAGQHLHFELYKGEWTADHHNAINPLSMIP